jgi:hypothetical protein
MKSSGSIIQRRSRRRILRHLAARIALVMAASLMAANLALAQGNVPPPWSLGGNARVVPGEQPFPFSFELSSRCPGPSGIFGCLEFGELTLSGLVFTPQHTLTFADLFELSTDYNPTTTDCGAGSPRFEIGLDVDGDGAIDGSIFVYIGPLYNLTGCLRGWQTTGNLIGAFDERYDLTQFRGRFFATYGEALSLVGEAQICYILLVVDSGWWPFLQPTPGTQIILANNVKINEFTLTATAPSAIEIEESQPVRPEPSRSGRLRVPEREAPAPSSRLPRPRR